MGISISDILRSSLKLKSKLFTIKYGWGKDTGYHSNVCFEKIVWLLTDKQKTATSQFSIFINAWIPNELF